MTRRCTRSSTPSAEPTKPTGEPMGSRSEATAELLKLALLGIYIALVVWLWIDSL
jgi:hypothetical protein